MEKYATLAGRVLIALIFIMAGFGKITDFAGTQAYMTAYGMPMTAPLAAAALIVELGAGLALVAGFQARLAGLALFLFLIPTTLIFHTDFSDMMQVQMFMKNLAIMGGLLLIAVHGAGPLSVDGKKGK